MSEIKYYTKEEHESPLKLSGVVRKIILLLLILFVVNVFVNIFFYKYSVDRSILVSPLPAQIIDKALIAIKSYGNSRNLEKVVQGVIQNDRNFAVVIENLKTGERYYFNEHKSYNSASLYKLWVMAVTYQQIEAGKLSKTEILSEDIATLNKKFSISSESADLVEGEVTWPVQNALEQMITISDNNSALLLTEKIGLANVSKFLQEYNLLDSKVGTQNANPVTSAHDILTFLKLLYEGQLADSKHTAEMINLLKAQRINTKLPKNLSKNVVIVHKTGELGGFSHDAGIVYTPKGDYIIVIMSKTEDVLSANEKIAEISKQVYSYFTR
jgi:beta-lactamase class A